MTWLQKWSYCNEGCKLTRKSRFWTEGEEDRVTIPDFKVLLHGYPSPLLGFQSFQLTFFGQARREEPSLLDGIY